MTRRPAAGESDIEAELYATWDAAITDVVAMRVTNAPEGQVPTNAEYRAMIAKLKRISLIATS